MEIPTTGKRGKGSVLRFFEKQIDIKVYVCIYIYMCVYSFFRKFFYPKNSLILVYMGLRFFPLSFGGSCPNTRSISKRFIFLQGYLARGTFSRSTLTRNCYCLYHFLLANLSCHVFLQHFSACLRAAFHILQSFC